MIIKMPAAYDVSHWKEILNFKLVNPRPLLFITKATEAYPGTGYNHTDDKFIRFFAGMREIGVHRGVFHFFRRFVDPVKQAQHFVNIVKPHVMDADILILDVEEGGEKASQLWAWFEYVKRIFPKNLLMVYSSRLLLDAIAMTEAEKEYFKKIPTWTAGYPKYPDLFSSVPNNLFFSYVPDQSKWGPVYLWQYSANGEVDGIIGDVDLNWISPVFISLLGETHPVKSDIQINIARS